MDGDDGALLFTAKATLLLLRQSNVALTDSDELATSLRALKQELDARMAQESPAPDASVATSQRGRAMGMS